MKKQTVRKQFRHPNADALAFYNFMRKFDHAEHGLQALVKQEKAREPKVKPGNPKADILRRYPVSTYGSSSSTRPKVRSPFPKADVQHAMPLGDESGLTRAQKLVCGLAFMLTLFPVLELVCVTGSRWLRALPILPYLCQYYEDNTVLTVLSGIGVFGLFALLIGTIAYASSHCSSWFDVAGRLNVFMFLGVIFVVVTWLIK